MSDAILIIDDDANLLAAMRRELCDRYTIKTAQGGEEAVALLATGAVIVPLVISAVRAARQ